MTIQVLGSGCPTCKKLFETTKRIATELGIKEEVEYITDVAKMVEMGVMQSPVLAVDGKPVLTGGGKSEEDVREALCSDRDAGKNKNESGGCCACCGGC